MTSLHCAICNKPAATSSFRRAPLPFFTTDQRIYISGGLRSDEYKSFPLCKNCYIRLQKGIFFIRKHFAFSIGGARGLQFWLIPSLDPTSAEWLLKYVESKPLYLNNLRSICEELTYFEYALAAERTEEAAETKLPFLTYTALFYHFDQQGHMRLLTSAEGIYPHRLRSIVKEKSQIDKKYPYFALPKFSSSLTKIRFGFPILADFWLYGKKVRGQKELADLISSIYLASELRIAYVHLTLIKKIRGGFREAGVGIRKLENLTELSLKALMIVEFLEKVGVVSMESSHVAVESKLSIENELVTELLKFLNGHQKVIVPGVLRAICCVGVLAGITLVEQEEKIGSTSFWNRLNRLELNFRRVKSLVSQTVEKLRQYRAMDKYEDLIAYILAMEISRLDENEARDISEDSVSLVFTIGLGEGYLLTKLANKQKVS